MADIQRQYTGIIKSRTDNYGFIVCEEIQKEYRRDVFIAPRSVSDRLYASLEQGNKVSPSARQAVQFSLESVTR